MNIVSVQARTYFGVPTDAQSHIAGAGKHPLATWPDVVEFCLQDRDEVTDAFFVAD